MVSEDSASSRAVHNALVVDDALHGASQQAMMPPLRPAQTNQQLESFQGRSLGNAP